MTTATVSVEAQTAERAVAWLRAHPGGGTAAEIAEGIGRSPSSWNFVFQCLSGPERQGLVTRARQHRAAQKWKAVNTGE
jgi:hypothetical protein